MVWGAIGYTSRLPLVRIDGTLNNARYVSGLSRPLGGTPHTLKKAVLAQTCLTGRYSAPIEDEALDRHEPFVWSAIVLLKCKPMGSPKAEKCSKASWRTTKGAVSCQVRILPLTRHRNSSTQSNETSTT
ncbi:hypothetical protein TNCV_540611 [Trichonephila clavipes]|nr:hypothetical protein TNCV_540611 [Trichonephila clavipes]